MCRTDLGSEASMWLAFMDLEEEYNTVNSDDVKGFEIARLAVKCSENFYTLKESSNYSAHPKFQFVFFIIHSPPSILIYPRRFNICP